MTRLGAADRRRSILAAIVAVAALVLYLCVRYVLRFRPAAA